MSETAQQKVNKTWPKKMVALTDWDDEGGECVTADDTAIVHDVLRGHLPTVVATDERVRSTKHS